MSEKALEQHGRLVAIEGPPSVVATQLKLIPKSPNLLVIPSVDTYLDEKGAYGEPFDARRYTLHVHRALEARHKEAMGFLRGSGHSKAKRIAFLNGGICAAHALCISAIKQHMTNGSLSRAGIIFDQIMRGGMEGVLTGGTLSPPQRSPIAVGDNYARLLHDSDHDNESDPVIRAMRRADALYERTASLDLSGYSNAEPNSIAATTSLAVPNIRHSRMSRNSRSSHFSHMSSTLQTPDTSQVEYGEARIVQMQPVTPTALKRVKSADRWYTRAELDAGTSPSALSRTQSTRTAPAVYTTTAETSKRDANRLRVTPPSPDNDGSADGQEQDTSQLSLDSATGRPKPSSRAFREAKRRETLLALRGQAPLKSLEELMPCREDLIVLLKDAALDPVLQFASDNLVEAGLPIHVCSLHQSAQAVFDDHDRLPAERRSAIETQNALRSFLAEILPASPEYDASLFGEVDNTDSVWESLSEASVKIKRSYDMILAVGAQDNVPKDYTRRVMRQLEDLGYKSTAEPRTQRIELSQLIGSAMQAYTSQPLASQTHNNPFADAALLAALLVSEINTFLSTTPEARYIVLDFPAQHLPTVFAMQSIMDKDSFKIAGIVDKNDEDTIRDFRKGRNKNREYRVAGSPTELSPQTPTFSLPSPSFSKVDYLLRSEAGEAEEAIFINAIWKRLIEIDESYAPSAEPSGSFNPDDILPPPSAPTSPRNVRFHIPFMGAPDSPPESPPGRPPTVPAPSEHKYLASTLFPAPATYTTLPPTHQQAARPASPDPTIASRGSSRKGNWSSRLGGRITRSGGIGFQRNLSRLFSRSAGSNAEEPAGPVLPPPGVVELGDEEDGEEEGHGDGELDADERRLLPLFGRRRREGTGSAKALRMLGIN